MQREVWFMTVDESGNAFSRGGRVHLPDGARVADFQDAIKASLPRRFAHVDFDETQVYASRAAFDAQAPPLKPDDDVATRQGVSMSEALVVVVPAVVDVAPKLAMKKQKTAWERSMPAPLAPERSRTNTLKLSANDVVDFRLNRSSLGHDVFVYCRNGVENLFNSLQCGVLENNEHRWILGPPGSGKSVAAAAFALSLDQSKWTVTWISVARGKAPPHCVRLEDKCKKTVSLKHPANLAELLEQVSDASKKHAVFLDGLIPSCRDDEQVECLKWLEADRENRRLVIASSIAIRDENTEVADDLLDVEEYFLFSWTLDEYLEANRDDNLFASVKSNLDACTPLPADPALQLTREALVRSKHYIAGDNARWMFAFDVTHIVTLVKQAVEVVSGAVGGSVGDAMNQLLSMFAWQKGFISQYVAAALTMFGSPTAVKRFGDVVSRDSCPESTEWMLEMYFSRGFARPT